VASEAAVDRAPTATQQYLDIAGVMFVVVNADETVGLINKKACEVLGYSEPEILGRNWFDAFLPERLRDEVRHVFRELMAGEAEAVEYYENPVLTARGDERIISWHNVVLTDETGISGTLSSGMDVTEQKRAEEERVRLAEEAAAGRESRRLAEERGRLVAELRNSQSARDRFYAMVNHELRNGLTGVFGWAELFARKNPDDRMAREVVEAAEYSIGILNDLLDLSRLDTEALKPDIRPADAAEIVGHAVKTVEPMAEENGVPLRMCGDSARVPCRTDAKRLQQILVNLLRNAVRHSARGSEVTIAVQAEDSAIALAVRDRGEGIRAEDVDIIFDAYQQAQSKAGGGAGLGLTLSRQLARLLGGDIVVTSVLGEGSTFTVTVARDLVAP
jgi:PAS domain S-box-containing protein